MSSSAAIAGGDKNEDEPMDNNNNNNDDDDEEEKKDNEMDKYEESKDGEKRDAPENNSNPMIDAVYRRLHIDKAKIIEKCIGWRPKLICSKVKQMNRATIMTSLLSGPARHSRSIRRDKVTCEMMTK